MSTLKLLLKCSAIGNTCDDFIKFDCADFIRFDCADFIEFNCDDFIKFDCADAELQSRERF